MLKAIRNSLLRNFAPHRLDLLDSDLRRRFRAPDSIPQPLMQLLLSDTAFTSKLKRCSGESMIQLAVVGNELRACIYTAVEADHLVPIYNDTWRIDGLFNFHVNVDGKITFLDRAAFSHLTYNNEDPEFCYRRVLTDAEEMELQPRYSHAHLRTTRH